MLKNKKVLAIIPARGGSKRLPRKNSLELAGKPLIAWSINAAKKSKYIDSVIVSTDCQEIADIATRFDARVPFLRPDHLASDNAKTADVILNLIGTIDESFDVIIILQPTSPLREACDIDEALESFLDKDAEGIISVCKTEHPPHWSGVLPPDKNLASFLNTSELEKRSQDLPQTYRLNGSIYIFSTQRFIDNAGVFYSDKVFAHIMPSIRSVDIDTLFDFNFAEFLTNHKIKRK